MRGNQLRLYFSSTDFCFRLKFLSRIPAFRSGGHMKSLIKQSLIIVLIIALVQHVALASAPMEPQVNDTIRTKVMHIGVGGSVDVKLSLNDVEISGRISEIKDTDFVVIAGDSGR